MCEIVACYIYYGSLLIPPNIYFNILKYLFQYFKLMETKLNKHNYYKRYKPI